MFLLRLAGINMADEASETMAGALKNWLGALGFILPLVGVEELIRHFVDTQHPSLPLLISIVLILAGLLIYASPAVWKRLKAQGATFFPAVRNGVRAFRASFSAQTSLATLQAPPLAASAAGQAYLAEAFVYSGSAEHGTKPWYSAKLTKNANNARFFIDHSHYAGGVMGSGGWTQRTRILIDGPKTLARDEGVRIEILSPFERDGQKFWRWGNVAECPTDNRYLFIERALHRGRVVFMTEDGTEEYAYFIVLQPDRSEHPEIPKVVGKWLFTFKQEWEAEDK
jgi:hypothetical protein